MEEVLAEAERRGWEVGEGKKYYLVKCPCGQHMKTVKCTPSGSNYKRNLLGRRGDAVKYLTIQEIRYAGSLSDLPGRIGDLADALHDLEDIDPAVEDPDLAARLTDGYIDVQMVIEAGDPAEAMTKALCTLRSAIHAIGDATPGWETERAIMHVAPADASERLFTDA